jgi:hypothetical protein
MLLAILGAAVAMHLPSAFQGFYADDETHQLALRGGSPLPKPPWWNLYDFGETADWTTADGAVDGVPWWTSPDWKIRFFRPLTSATLALDHALFGDWAPGYHLTSFAWYAALLLAVHSLYLSLGLEAGAALLALALYAATNGATLPVGWPANRNSVLALLGVVAAVRVALGGRAAFRPAAAPLAVLLAGLACLAKESGVLAFALLAVGFGAEALRAEGRDASRRAAVAAAACLGAGLAFVAWLGLAGFGTRSGFYATPWSDTWEYAGNLLVLFSAGPLRLIAPVSLDLGMIFPAIVVPACLLALGLVAFVAYRMIPALKRRPEAGVLLAWLGLSLAAEGGAPPSDRLLLSAAIGSAGLLAIFVTSVRRDLHAPRRDRILALALVTSAGALGAAFTVVQSQTMAKMAIDTRRTSTHADVGPASLGARDVLVLQAENAFVPFSLGAVWALEPGDPDLRIRVLQMGRRGLAWVREDDATFLLRSEDEPFLTHPMEGVFLASSDPPPAGARWRTPAFTAEAVEVDPRGLRAVRFRMHRSLDDPHVRFLIERRGELVSIAPPKVGETIVVPRAVPQFPLVL